MPASFSTSNSPNFRARMWNLFVEPINGADIVFSFDRLPLVFLAESWTSSSSMIWSGSGLPEFLTDFLPIPTCFCSFWVCFEKSASLSISDSSESGTFMLMRFRGRILYFVGVASSLTAVTSASGWARGGELARRSSFLFLPLFFGDEVESAGWETSWGDFSWTSNCNRINENNVNKVDLLLDWPIIEF